MDNIVYYGLKSVRLNPPDTGSWIIITRKHVNTYLDVEILSLYNIPQTRRIHRPLTVYAFLHTFVYTLCLCLVSQPISQCPNCKQWWIIKYVVLPEAPPQVCIFQRKLQQFQFGPHFLHVLEFKSKFNGNMVANALNRPHTLNKDLIGSVLFL